LKPKVLHRFLLKAYVGPFLATFFVVEFILVLQFLWKYVDDLVGKGFDTFLIMKLMALASVSFVPMALPLAILLATLMTFGNLGEFFELTAIKSGGISLWRFMRPLTGLTMVWVVFAFFFSNNILPVVNLKFQTLLYDIREQRPALSIQPGVYYNGIDGYSIHVGKKDDDGKTLRQITIYDHSERRGNTKYVFAKKGVMESVANNHYLVLQLFDGFVYQEIQPKAGEKAVLPAMKMEFKEQQVGFDLSAFRFSRTQESTFKDVYTMLTVKQLSFNIDSLKIQKKNRIAEVAGYQNKYYALVADSNFAAVTAQPSAAFEWEKLLPDSFHILALQDAKNSVSSVKSYTSMLLRDMEYQQNNISVHLVERHKKFTLSVACLVLFLIGAPLGAIIKKGGFGLPMLFSILFFLVYHVTSMIGEKMAESGKLQPWQGMWLATFLLLPVGLILMVRANTDTGGLKSLFKKKS
jgi:lipopolysaccharide export system permease protein